MKGGIVAYILQPGDLGYETNKQHGLIASPTDIGRGISWYKGYYNLTSAIESAIGSGETNTSAILKVQGPGNYAAKLCGDLVIEGYKDWFLPSKDELNQLYLNKDEIGGFVDNIFENTVYCSSTEYDGNMVSCQNFLSGKGEVGNYYKRNHYNVRAVRYF